MIGLDATTFVGVASDYRYAAVKGKLSLDGPSTLKRNILIVFFKERALSQVLSIKPTAGLSEQSLSLFLEKWCSIGSFTAMEYGYSLTERSGESGIVTLENGEIVFQGQFSEEGMATILSFADSLGSKLLLEGESLLTEGEGAANSLRLIGKAIVGFVLLPVAIVVLPILMLILVARLVFTLTREGDSGNK
jgi:hypothetical protein